MNDPFSSQKEVLVLFSVSSQLFNQSLLHSFQYVQLYLTEMKILFSASYTQKLGICECQVSSLWLPVSCGFLGRNESYRRKTQRAINSSICPSVHFSSGFSVLVKMKLFRNRPVGCSLSALQEVNSFSERKLLLILEPLLRIFVVACLLVLSLISIVECRNMTKRNGCFISTVNIF